MKHDFLHWKKLHDDASLELFNTENDGQLWLKLKSIIRPELVEEFTTQNNIQLQSTKEAKKFEELYDILSKNIDNSHILLDKYIREKNVIILNKLDVSKLVSELYKLKVFEWGGDYNNSLDKYLVRHYVKAISSYEDLAAKFDTEINPVVKGYVLNSWYNHWSSILIEHIFKSHKYVLPTVGQIKNVDFFINKIPFDLKVTYFPAEYLKQKRKERGLPVELTFLKTQARNLKISFNKEARPSDIYYEITEKMKDRGSKECFSVINQLKKENMEIVLEAKENTKLLSKWLYENQGEMRFGSENRIFLVLIDSEDFSSSWKLKRNMDLLKPSIYKFLDSFIKINMKELGITFNYSGKSETFYSLAEVVFVIK